MLSTSHVGIVALVVILLFGTKRLPELGTGLGKAISNFKLSFKDGAEGDDAQDCAKTGHQAKSDSQ